MGLVDMEDRAVMVVLYGAAGALLLLVVAGLPLVALAIALLVPVLALVAVRPQRGLLLLVLLVPFDGTQQVLGLPGWVDGWKEALVLFTLLCALLALVAWVAVAALSAVWARDLQALVGLKINYFYVLAAFVAWRCPFTRAERDRLVSILMATGLACAVYGIVQQLMGGNALLRMGYELDTNVAYIGTYLRSFSTFVQPSQFGFFMMIVLLVGIPAALASTHRARNRAFLLALPVYLLGLLSSFSRGAVLGLGVGLVYLGVRRYRVLIAALPLAAVALLVLNVLGGAAIGTFRDPTSLGERTTSWQENLVQIAEHPFGAGVGRSGAASEKAVELEISGTSFQPDNYYFKTAYELGVIGLWVFVLFMIAAWRSVDVAAARGDPRNASFLDGVAAGILAAAIASIVATYFEIYPMDVLFWVLLGVAASSAASVPADRAGGAAVRSVASAARATPIPVPSNRSRVR